MSPVRLIYIHIERTTFQLEFSERATLSRIDPSSPLLSFRLEPLPFCYPFSLPPTVSSSEDREFLATPREMNPRAIRARILAKHARTARRPDAMKRVRVRRRSDTRRVPARGIPGLFPGLIGRDSFASTRPLRTGDVDIKRSCARARFRGRERYPRVIDPRDLVAPGARGSCEKSVGN